MHVCTWDKYIRAVDMASNQVTNAFVCSKETVRCIHLSEEYLFIAGSDPVIRRFDHFDKEPKEQKIYNGHKGWVNQIISKANLLFSGGDDSTIIVWNIESGKQLDILHGHENSITSLIFAFGDLYSGSYDHHIICWDLELLEDRLEEKAAMR